MTTGNRRLRARWPWLMGGALAVLALAPATVLAQGPTALPPPAPANATRADARTDIAPAERHSAVPVTVIDRTLLETTGAASLGQALQQLSWQSNAINAQFNNGGDGSSRIALRGLGAARTLVLVNGRRQVHGGTGADASVDLQSIPLALVERVEIVRGPSGIHGPGGVAGVVNIVTRQDLDGVDATAFAGATPDGLGRTYDASVTLGKRFERGRVTAVAGAYRHEAVLAADRAFSRNDRFYDWATGQVLTAGSTAVPEGAIIDYGEDVGNQAWQALREQYPGEVFFVNDPAAGWRPFRLTGTSDTGAGDSYNYQLESYLVTPLSRHHVFVAGDYQLGDRLRAFAEASYVNRGSAQQLAAEPLFTAAEGVTVSEDNVYNPFGRDFFDLRRRVVEAGNRRAEQDIDTTRLVLGLDGVVPLRLGTPSPWRWQASYGYGATTSAETARGNLRRDRLATALGPSFIDAGGQARCGTPDSPIDGCVPLDLFGGAGSITPEMLSYIGHTSVHRGRNQQHRLALDAGGDLVRTRSGTGATLAVGAEYRQESGSFHPDATDTTGVALTALDGSYDASGVHAALAVLPFLDPYHDRAVELQATAHAFDLGAAGTGATWHVAALARLGPALAVRASQGRGARAPSIAQRFTGAVESFPVVSDPCAASFAPRSPDVEANCRADGVPDDLVEARQQLPARVGGDPELAPELADIRSAGVVLTPALTPGLTLSADYIHIAVRDQVNQLGAAHILQSCYDRPPGERSHCDRIVRDPATGAIDVIVDTLTNRGTTETAGIDVQLTQDIDTAMGRLRYRVGGAWLHEHDVAGSDDVVQAARGVYDLGAFPDYRLDGALRWDRGALGAGVHARYVGSFTECENNDCAIGRDQDVQPRSREVESYFTADVLGALSLPVGPGRTMLSLGVRNLLDRRPPVIRNGFLASSDAATYDFTGRFAYLRLTQQF
jgi:iron complex outermembrane receptor protein